MKADNSRSFEEKFQEGYTTRCNELVHANLILIENELYELTDEQLSRFHAEYDSIRGNDINAKNLRAIILESITLNCICINTITHCYNY